MKRWTRKLLAGLLSFGMLLQVASPLSALAADTSGAAQATPVSSLIIRDSYSSNATVKYTLNHYADGSVSWENNEKPFDGINVKYDTATSTFVFTGMLSLPQSSKPYVNLTCTKPEEDSIKLDGNGDSAVGAALTVGFPNQTRGAKNITIVTDSSSSAAIKGYATIDCFGNVTITNPSGKVTGGATQTAEGILVYGNAENVTVAGNDSDYIISDSFSVYSKGNVTLTNPSGSITKSYIRVYESTGDVKIEGSSNNGLAQLIDTTFDSTMIKAKTLTMKNNGGTVGKVKFTKPAGITENYVAYTNEAKTVVMDALPNGDVVASNYLCVEPGEKTAVKHTLTLTNAKAYTDENHTVEADKNEVGIYSVPKGTKVYVVAEAPDNVSQWKFTGWEERSETSENITVTVNENMILTANWAVETPEPDEGEEVPYGITVTMNNDEAIEVTSKNCENILGDTYTNGKLTYDPESHTLTGTGTFGKLKINITAADSVDVKLSNDAGGIVVDGSLTVDGAQNVTVVSKNAADSDSFGTVVCGDVTINCTGNILLENEGTGDVIGGSSASRTLKVVKAHDVTIRGVCNANESTKATYTIFGSAEIDCTGNVEITSDTFVAVKTDLTVNGAQNVTIAGNQDSGATIGGDAEITCSGAVTLENKGSGNAVSGELKYTPNPSTKPYEIKAGTDAADAASKEPVATKEAGGTFSETVAASYINIAPASSGDTTPDDTGTVDSGSDAGGAVAAVLVGSAAVWGGYEIATRVILHNILPEGAAIPANRGQLALLVWNNAGRPEPAAQPAFADVADADMAKAAQWCVEQGIMEAKTAETFKPEGWTPKLKVIEVWNKAFPKQ